MIASTLFLLAQAAPAAGVPCRWEEHRAGITFVQFGPDRDCRAWLPAEERTGVWLYEFEGSRFVEDAVSKAQALTVKWDGPRVSWFSFDAKSRFPPGCHPQLGQAYLIQFRGRRAAPAAGSGPGRFGHMGLWSGEVLLDDATLVRDLGPLPGAQVRAAPRDSGCR